MFPITFVSLGPGEAELITLKGLKALQAADCIFCPETPARDGRPLSRAADIMLRLDIPAGHIRRFSLPMSKQRTDALNAYDRVYAEALSLHHAGRKVAVVAASPWNRLPASPPSSPPERGADCTSPARKRG